MTPEEKLKKQIERRAKIVTRSTMDTEALIKALQDAAVNQAADYAGRLVVDSLGKLESTVENTNKAVASGRMFGGWLSRQIKRLVSSIVSKVKDVLDGNQNFYEDTAPPEVEVPQTVHEKALDIILRRLGYDLKKDEIVDGGWFDSLVNDHKAGAELGRQLADAVGQGISLEEFKTKFRRVFADPKGIGYLDRYFNTFANDFYMMIDRAAANEYRKELGYTKAIWSGTIMDDSRPICIKYNNLVVTEELLLALGKTTFKGKKKNHDMFLDLGGYNCRHILSWIADFLADAIEKGVFDDPP
jgi:hypothetical protein